MYSSPSASSTRKNCWTWPRLQMSWPARRRILRVPHSGQRGRFCGLGRLVTEAGRGSGLAREELVKVGRGRGARLREAVASATAAVGTVLRAEHDQAVVIRGLGPIRSSTGVRVAAVGWRKADLRLAKRNLLTRLLTRLSHSHLAACVATHACEFVLELGASLFAGECSQDETARARNRGQSATMDGDHSVKRRGRSAGPSALSQRREREAQVGFWGCQFWALQAPCARLQRGTRGFPLRCCFLSCCCSALFPTEPQLQTEKKKNAQKKQERRQGSQRQGSASGSSTTSSSSKQQQAAAAAAAETGGAIAQTPAAVANRRFSRASAPPFQPRSMLGHHLSPRKKRSPIHPCLHAIHHRPHLLLSVSRRGLHHLSIHPVRRFDSCSIFSTHPDWTIDRTTHPFTQPRIHTRDSTMKRNIAAVVAVSAAALFAATPGQAQSILSLDLGWRRDLVAGPAGIVTSGCVCCARGHLCRVGRYFGGVGGVCCACICAVGCFNQTRSPPPRGTDAPATSTIASDPVGFARLRCWHCDVCAATSSLQHGLDRRSRDSPPRFPPLNATALVELHASLRNGHGYVCIDPQHGLESVPDRLCRHERGCRCTTGTLALNSSSDASKTALCASQMQFCSTAGVQRDRRQTHQLLRDQVHGHCLLVLQGRK
ncbi:hypothetical protein L1887_61160 [Cichorium endivia]|nr:hypothetical protein L1887_61160 [Cichorium endivia]